MLIMAAAIKSLTLNQFLRKASIVAVDGVVIGTAAYVGVGLIENGYKKLLRKK